MGQKEHPNFYENYEEATQRLNMTCVLYDGKPYVIIGIDPDHKDGIFRVYLRPFAVVHKMGTDLPQAVYELMRDGGRPWPAMDKWLETKAGKDSSHLRKQMNSPLFDGFKPFPIGFVNKGGTAIHVERTPMRARPQGLTTASLIVGDISIQELAQPQSIYNGRILWGTEELTDTILGKYPSYRECVAELSKAGNTNLSAAFHRNFAIFKGPLRTLFLAHKTRIIGVLERGGTHVALEKAHEHLRESVVELSIARDIEIRA